MMLINGKGRYTEIHLLVADNSLTWWMINYLVHSLKNHKLSIVFNKMVNGIFDNCLTE